LSTESITIEIADQQRLKFDQLPLLESARIIMEDHGFMRGEISIAVVDDQHMKTLNRQYLGHDYETDVLSFVMESDPASHRLDGQLIVSAETAQRVAEELQLPLDDELLLYVVHGMLHLVGLRDDEPHLAAVMRSAEANYLARFGVSHHWDDDAPESWKERN
jgi:probable rRNA maturation factor